MRLNFPLHSLPAIREGTKTATIRFGLARLPEPGEPLALAFGRRDKPVVLERVVARAERLDLTELVAAAMEPDLVPDDPDDPDGFHADADPLAWMEASGYAHFLAACRASGNDPYEILADCIERQDPAPVVIYWRSTVERRAECLS